MKKRLLLCLITLLTLVPAGARVPHYPFVRGDLNTLEMPAGASPTYNRFLRKLDTLIATGGVDVRVLHVGGSHVQGGTWSDRLRRNFLSLRYGADGGRGLVFPFSAAGTNTPSSYSSSYAGNWEGVNCLKPHDVTLGLTGMAVTARDTSARVVIDLLPREAHLLQQRYTFNRVDVLGEGTLEPVLLLGKKDTLRGVKGHFVLPFYTDWVQLGFEGKGYYTLRGLYLDKPGQGFSLMEAGVNGASTTAWLRCELWEQDLRRVMPDLVIFSIGINDSWRRRDVNSHTEAAEKAFRELAKECAGVFWDWYKVMGGYGSMARWQEAGLAQADKVHFTPAGYKLVADLLFDAIIDSYHKRR